MRKVSRAEEQLTSLDFITAHLDIPEREPTPNITTQQPNLNAADRGGHVGELTPVGEAYHCQYCGRGDCGGGCESEKRYHDEDNHWGNKHTNVQSDW